MGTIAWSSSLVVLDDAPTDASTPTTWSGTPLMLTVWPSGSRPEELAGRGRAEHGDGGHVLLVGGGDEPALGQGAGADRQPGGRGAHHAGGPVGRARGQGLRGQRGRGDRGDVRRGRLGREGGGVLTVSVVAEPSRRAPRRTGRAARGDDQQVGAQRVDLGPDLRRRALAEPDGEDHRRDPDQDAEHGQGGAQPVRADGFEPGPQRLPPVHWASITAPPPRTRCPRTPGRRAGARCAATGGRHRARG